MRRMPEFSLLRMRVTPDLGTFAPLVYAHAHKRKNIYFEFIQLKIFNKQHNSTKLDKSFRLVYKLSCLIVMTSAYMMITHCL
jgi:hypothetical protein